MEYFSRQFEIAIRSQKIYKKDNNKSHLLLEKTSPPNSHKVSSE